MEILLAAAAIQGNLVSVSFNTLSGSAGGTLCRENGTAPLYVISSAHVTPVVAMAPSNQ
jgi:hypothetical protein